jgi:hypothetical protein
LESDGWTRDITIPLSISVILQFHRVRQDTVGIGLDMQTEDRLV